MPSTSKIGAAVGALTLIVGTILWSSIPAAQADTNYHWTSTNDSAVSRLSSTNFNDMVEFGGKLYAVMEDSSDQLWAYSDNAWANVSPSLIPDGQSGKFLAVHNNKLYLAAADNEQIYVYIYNGSTWTTDTSFASSGTYDYIYAFGQAAGSICAALRGPADGGTPTTACAANTTWTQYPPDNGLSDFNYGAAHFSTVTIANQDYAALSGVDSSGKAGIWYLTSTWVRLSTPFTNSLPFQFLFRSLLSQDHLLYAGSQNSNTGEMAVYKYGQEGQWTKLSTTGMTDASGYGVQALAIWKNQLVGAIQSYDGTQVFAFNQTTNSWDTLGPAGFTQANDQSQFYTFNLVSYNTVLYANAANNSEGFYNGHVWAMTDPTPPTDNDGIDSAIEDAGPNNGDANDDGTPDSQQVNVASLPNPVTSQYTVLAATGTCQELSGVSIHPESNNATADSQFSYPLGLIDFTVTCSVSGGSATITQYYYGTYTASEYVARKYSTASHTYQTIPNATITNVTMDGGPAVRVVYTITDGSALDDDGLANGTIVDPAGLALAATTTATPTPNSTSLPTESIVPTSTGSGLPSTGGQTAAGVGLAILAVGAALYIYRHAK